MLTKLIAIEEVLRSSRQVNTIIESVDSGKLATWLVDAGYKFTVHNDEPAMVRFRIYAKSKTVTILPLKELELVPVEIDSKITRLNQLLVEAKENGKTTLTVHYDSDKVKQLILAKLIEAGYQANLDTYYPHNLEIRW